MDTYKQNKIKITSNKYYIKTAKFYMCYNKLKHITHHMIAKIFKTIYQIFIKFAKMIPQTLNKSFKSLCQYFRKPKINKDEQYLKVENIEFVICVHVIILKNAPNIWGHV